MHVFHLEQFCEDFTKPVADLCARIKRNGFSQKRVVLFSIQGLEKSSYGFTETISVSCENPQCGAE